MFRQIIFVIMLSFVLALSGCAAIDKGQNATVEKGQNIEKENDYRSGYPPRGGYSRTTPHKVLVSEACWIEANNLVSGQDFMSDDRARRTYFSQCMLRNGYNADGNYIGIPPK